MLSYWRDIARSTSRTCSRSIARRCVAARKPFLQSRALVVNTKTKGFTQVANDLIRAKTLTASQKLLLIGLQSFAFGSKRVVFPSQAELGRCLRLDRKTIR